VASFKILHSGNCIENLLVFLDRAEKPNNTKTKEKAASDLYLSYTYDRVSLDNLDTYTCCCERRGREDKKERDGGAGLGLLVVAFASAFRHFTLSSVL